MRNVREFLDIYNRLDRYLQDLCNVHSNKNLVSYYERTLPEKRRSEMKTVREFKNSIESHGVSVGGQMPIPPRAFVDFLHNELRFCKNNKELVIRTVKAELAKKSLKNAKNNGSHINVPKACSTCYFYLPNQNVGVGLLARIKNEKGNFCNRTNKRLYYDKPCNFWVKK